MREALFSILGGRSPARRVLDLYAGTGALGLEALSRGAESVVFVERSKEALAALDANVEMLGVRSRVQVVALPVERAARALTRGSNGEETGRFDLVFADPPYADVASGAAVKVLETLVVPLLDEGGLVVLEHASRDPSPTIAALEVDASRTYGDTTLTFYVGAVVE